MKKLLIIMGLMAMCLQGQAQFDRGFVRGMWDTRDAAQALRDNITNDLKHRTDKRQVLPNKKWLLDEDHFWTNGFVVFEAYYDEESHEIGINPQCDNPQEINDPMTVLSVKGTKVSKALNKNPITVERLGGHVMMVERNSQGQPISAYYMVTADEYNRGTWVLLLQQVLAGNYTTPNGSNVVFGPKMPFYSGDAWHTDPGVYERLYGPEHPLRRRACESWQPQQPQLWQGARWRRRRCPDGADDVARDPHHRRPINQRPP